MLIFYNFCRFEHLSSLSARVLVTHPTLMIMRKKPSGSPQQRNARKNLMISKHPNDQHHSDARERETICNISGEK